MHRKFDHRVGATQAAWLSLSPLFVRGWSMAPGVSRLAGKSNQADDTQGRKNTNGKQDEEITPS
jgi:hypothetical protein